MGTTAGEPDENTKSAIGNIEAERGIYSGFTQRLAGFSSAKSYKLCRFMEESLGKWEACHVDKEADQQTMIHSLETYADYFESGKCLQQANDAMELVSDSNAVLEPFIKMPLPSIEFAR